MKKLDPNLESLSSIKVRVSQSTISLNPFSASESTRSSSDLRRSLVASSEIDGMPSKSLLDVEGDED